MIICYLPPIKGTRKVHWYLPFANIQELLLCSVRRFKLRALQASSESSRGGETQKIPLKAVVKKIHMLVQVIHKRHVLQLSACIRLVTLPETNSSHLKMNPWKRRFLLETIIFRCELLVLGRVLTLSLVAEPPAHPMNPCKNAHVQLLDNSGKHSQTSITTLELGCSRVDWHYFAVLMKAPKTQVELQERSFQVDIFMIVR